MQLRKRRLRRRLPFFDKKLASVEALEEEITKLKSSLTESNREATRLKKDMVTLNEQLESMSHRRNDLEVYLKALVKSSSLCSKVPLFCPTALLFASHCGSVESLTP